MQQLSLLPRQGDVPPTWLRDEEAGRLPLGSQTARRIVSRPAAGDEMACLANDLSDSGQTVVAGFSTHPHWDHLLWHARLGAAPRYGTARCAATARDRLSDGLD